LRGKFDKNPATLDVKQGYMIIIFNFQDLLIAANRLLKPPRKVMTEPQLA
jgi:hypothetical protein